MTRLTHLDESGAARMVDVSGKAVTAREAVATGIVTMTAETLAAIHDGKLAKGDVLAVARIAGIQAAKRTSELIPLCHPLGLSSVPVDFERLDNGPPESPQEETAIHVWPNGPLAIRGHVHIVGPGDQLIREDTRVALCRCGHSENKPF